MYAAPNLDLLWKDDFSLMEFPKENLKFLEKLGEGQFGEVPPSQISFSCTHLLFSVIMIYLQILCMEYVEYIEG